MEIKGLTRVRGKWMPLTRLRCADSTGGERPGLNASSSVDSFSATSESPASDCIPIIAALSLHSAVTKSRNALSSRFFDASKIGRAHV